MTVTAMIKNFEQLNIGKVRELAVSAVHQHEDVVVSDSIVANIEGLTFLGTSISTREPFSDWEETGEFHENLKLATTSDIEFTSRGEGFLSIDRVFDFEETIAPHYKTLDISTIEAIKQSFINNLLNTLK